MRKNFSTIMLVAAAAMTFASCQKEENYAPETISATLTLNTEVEQTKTYLDEENTVLWGEAESVVLGVMAGNADPKFVTSTSTDAYNGQASASFVFSLNDIAKADSYTIGGVYPASASKGISNENGEAYKVALPATQNASVDNYDPAAFIMVMKPETVQTIPSTYTASFRRAVALNKITLTGVKENISSVEVTVPQDKYLAGRRFIDLTTGKSGEIYENGGRTNTVKVNADYPSGSIDVWFTSWGVELKPGDKLTVKMTSEAKIYTRTITANENGIKFVEGDLNKLKVNMSSAEEEVLDNMSGEYLIAAVPQNWNLMSGTNGGKYYSHVASNVKTTAANVKCSDFYGVANIEECVWTLAKVDGGYSIKNKATGKYVSYTGSSNEAYVSTTAVPMALTQNAGVTTVESVAVAGRKLQYNASSPRFAFYTTNQTQLYFIPWVADTTPRIFVSKAEYEVQAAGGSVELTYSTNSYVEGSVTATVKTGATMSISSVNVAAGKVTVNYAENTEGKSKAATIVLSYNGAESKEVVINQAGAQTGGGSSSQVILSEQFDNSTTADSSTAITSSKFPNFSGQTSKAYTSKYGGLKLGSSSAVGYITSKSLDLSSSFTVQIDACKYGSDTGNIVVTVGSQEQKISNSQLAAAGTFKTFTLSFNAATSSSTVKIATSAKRAYIDNVVITRN